MNKNLPKIAENILRLILPENAKEYLIGDIEDFYNTKYEKYGYVYALVWCYITILVNATGFLKSSIQWGITMLLNNLKISFRHLWRQKFFSAINIFCLTLSLFATMFIWFWINDEVSYDDFHLDGDLLYRLEAKFDFEDKTDVWGSTPQFLAEELKKDFEQITDYVTFHQRYNTILNYENEIIQTKNCYYSTPDISNLFDIQLINGEMSDALKDPSSIVLSNNLAKKIFKNSDPIGKTIRVNNELSLIVKGVFNDLPDNTHLKMQCIIPISVLEPSQDWGRYDFENYIKVSNAINVSELKGQVKNFLQKFRNTNTEINLRPVKEIHLYSAYGNGNIENVYFFTLIGIIILTVGCINYINLSTARSTLREKEIGIRKVVGAEKSHLIKQLFTESFLTTILSFVFTIILLILFIDQFNFIANKNLTLLNILNQNMLLGVLCIVIVTSIFSGIYPAFYISKYNPYRNINTNKGSAKSGIRKILIVTQFVVAVVLITFTIFVNEQLDFIKNKELGFDKEQIFCVQTNKLGNQLNSYKNQINKIPGVIKTAVASQVPVNMGNFTFLNYWDNKRAEKSIKFVVMSVDINFLDLMGMKLSSGSNFQPHHNENKIIVNETAILRTNIKDPLSKKIKYWSFEGAIQGVLKDFHNKPLHRKIEPMIFYHNKTEKGNYLFVKINTTDVKSLITNVENEYKKLSSSTPFNYSFLDENIDRMYKSEMNFQVVVKYFSVITIIIALLGLIGLTVFAAERKTKEIGIRKVLGASMINIFNLISKEFIIMILLSNIIAIPFSYYFIKNWLENYTYKITIAIIPFFFISASILLIGYFTILINVYKKASLNPVESIKDE